MRDAALHARDVMFEQHPDSKAAVLLRSSSIARAVWSADLKLFNIITRESQLAREHLQLVGGVPSLRNPAAFGERFRAAKLEASGDREESIRAEHRCVGLGAPGNESISGFDAARRTARIKHSKGLGKLWLPVASAFVIMGVRVSADEASEFGISGEGTQLSRNGWVTSPEPSHFFKAFASVWGKVFGACDVNMEMARSLIDEYLAVKQWDWSKLIHPNLQIIEYILSKLKSTAPGLDGIVNAAWRFGGGCLP